MDPITATLFGGSGSPSLTGGDAMAKGENVVNAYSGAFFVRKNGVSNAVVIGLGVAIIAALVWMR